MGNLSKENRDDLSLSDILEEEHEESEESEEYEEYEESDYFSEEYEDDYVYGDSDEIDRDKYINKEELEESLEEKVDRKVNKIFDFFESKRFTAFQWTLAVGLLLLMWGVLYLVSGARQNVEDNAVYQEESRSSYIAKDIASEDYQELEEREAEKELQKQELDKYIEEKSTSYESQKRELGELPEGYTEIMDIDGNVQYLSPKEYEEYLSGGVADSGDNEDTFDEKDIDIVPSEDYIWDNINFGNLSELEEEDVFQTRGEYIYFAQRVIAFSFPNQVLDSDFDTEEFILTVYRNPNASFELPDDFEERMNYAFDHSGYGSNHKGSLVIEYKDGDL